MYALANVKKFLEDNADRLGDRVEEILARAEEQSHDGILSGGAIKDIMQDDGLAREFHDVVMSDPNHVQIGLSAMREVQS